MRTPLIALIVVSFIVTSIIGPLPNAHADSFVLPKPGVMVRLSPPMNPAILKGIKVNPNNPFQFEFILDQGDEDLPSGSLKEEANKLIKYFLASLTIPESDLWVNLSPYEKDRIIPNSFGLTEMGRDLLAQDYLLKQITASLIYPEDEIGKTFWKRIYEEASARYGTTNIPVNTFNKVWIVPNKAVVYENSDAVAGSAYVVESSLKVMLESDYLAIEKNTPTMGHVQNKTNRNVSQSTLPTELGLQLKAPQGNNSDALANQIIREVVIPQLEKEINEGANFVQLRQVYNSLILGQWYKKKIKDSILSQVYADQNKIEGIKYQTPTRGHVQDKNNENVSPSSLPSEKAMEVKATQSNELLDVETIYQNYLQAFKKGVYNYIKEEADPLTQQSTARKYFSGGVNFFGKIQIETRSDGAMLSWIKNTSLKHLKGLLKFTVDLKSSIGAGGGDPSKFFNALPFKGVGLLDFLRAQKKLKRTKTSLERFQTLAQKGYTDQILQEIKENTQEDIRLDSVVDYQSGNPRGQAIFEAIANSIDALGGDIGQFGKGVKQIIAWLHDTEDRVDIISKQAGAQAWRLTIKKDLQTGYQIQIYPMKDKDFTRAAGIEGMVSGTIVRIGKEKGIATQGQVNSLQWIKEHIHSRFWPVENIRITTQINGEEIQKVNGWEDREFIVPFGHQPQKSDQKRIHAQLNDYEVKIVDNGPGMNIAVLSGMMIPGEGGTKAKQSLSDQEIQQEISKLMVIHLKNPSSKNKISFIRNKEVIMRLEISEKVHPDSIIQGELALEFAKLIQVQQSRDKVIFTSGHDAKQTLPMLRALEAMIEGILNSPIEKNQTIKYINTIVAGLEALIADNQENAYVVHDIKKTIKNKMKPLIESMKASGKYVLLPNEISFSQLSIPKEKEAIFVNEDLFEWAAQQSLIEIGARAVRYDDFHLIAYEGNRSRTKEVIIADFKDAALHPFANFNPKEFNYSKHHPLPKIQTHGYVIIPSQIGSSFLSLLEKRRKEVLSKEESSLLLSLAERIKLFAEDSPATGYEMTPPQATAAILENVPPDYTLYQDGQVDNLAISKFLIKPPSNVELPDKVHVPIDAQMRYFLKDGKIIEIETGRTMKLPSTIKVLKIKALGKDYVWIEFEGSVAGQNKGSLFKATKEGILELALENSSRQILSPDGRHIVYKDEEGFPEIFDTLAGLKLEIVPKGIKNLMMQTQINVFGPEISSDGRFFVFKYGQHSASLKDYFIFDVRNGKLSDPIDLSWGGRLLRLDDPSAFSESISIHPNSAIMQSNFEDPNDSKRYYVDLENGKIITKAKSCYIDQLSGVALFFHGDYVEFYNLKTKKYHNMNSTERFFVLSLQNSLKGNRLFLVIKENNIGDYVIDQNFNVIDEPRLSEKSSEAFNAKGELNINNRRIDLTLNFAKVFQHSSLPLIIDESDPNNKKAYDLNDFEEMKYEGKRIVGYVQDKKLLITSSDDGGAALGGAKRTGVFDEKGMNIIYEEQNQYRWVKGDLTLVSDNLPISPQDFPKVHFDGKYFVFYNPLSGKALYLDPSNPQELQIATQQDSFLKNIPLDKIGSPWLVVRKGTGFNNRHYEVSDLRDSLKQPVVYANVKHYSDGVFVASKKNDSVEIYTPQGVVQVPAQHSVKEIKGSWAIIEGRHGTSILNIFTGINTPINSIYHLSDSGNYMTTHNGVEIEHYNLETNNVQLILKEINRIQSPQDLKIHYLPGTDVLITTRETIDDDFFYELKLGSKLSFYAADIAQDQSRRFIVYTPRGREYSVLFDLKTNKELIRAKEIYIGHYEGVVTIGIVGIENYVNEVLTYYLNQDDQLVANPSVFPKYWEKFDTSEAGFPSYLSIATYDQGFKEQSLSDPISGEGTRFLSGDLLGFTDPRSQAQVDWNSIRVYRFNPYSRNAVTYPILKKDQLGAFEKYSILYGFDPGSHEVSFVDIPESGFMVDINDGINVNDNPRIYVTNDSSFVLTHGKQGLILISDQNPAVQVRVVPEGFELQGVHGNYFMFYNPNSNEVRYLDPQAYLSKHTRTLSWNELPEEIKEQRTQLWRQVTDKRDQIIAKARAAYDPLLEIMPLDNKNDLIKIFDDFYFTLEHLLHERFRMAVKDNRDQVNFDNLEIDSFLNRMKMINEALNALKRQNDPLLLTNELLYLKPDVRRDQFNSYFSSLVQLATNSEIAFDHESVSSIALVSSNGFDFTSSQHLIMAKPLLKLLRQLYELYGKSLDPENTWKMLAFLSMFCKTNPQNIEIVDEQLGKLLNFAGNANSESYVKLWYESFKNHSLVEIESALKNRSSDQNLADALPFIDFLTNKVDRVSVRNLALPEVERWIDLPKLPIENIDQFNAGRKVDQEGQEPMYKIEEIFSRANVVLMQDIDNPTLREEISKYVRMLGEAGRHAAEIPQNSVDANASQLTLRYYKNPATGEVVQEYVDNGEGPPMGKALALIIRKSNKNSQKQSGDVGGFFGTGKFTIYSGVDRVQIISNNGQEAYVFELEVDRRNGYVFLTRVGIAQSQSFEKGVTIRRIKKVENTIPELDQMIAKRNLKMMAGMSVDEKFKIILEKENAQGKIVQEELSIKSRTLLTHRDLIIDGKNYGLMKLWSTQDPDMPMQIIDKGGRRVESLALKEKFLGLIPQSLRKYKDVLRLVIQIPLPLIENRSSFVNEEVLLPIIQQYIAIEFYKALIHQELTNSNFHISQIPRDWETSANSNYWNNLDASLHPHLILKDQRHLFDVVKDINQGQVVSHDELLLIKSWFDNDINPESSVQMKQQREESLISFLLQLNVITKDGINSLLMRRIKTQALINKATARAQANRLGVNFQQAVSTVDSQAASRQSMARLDEKGKYFDDESAVIPPAQLNDQHKRLIELVQRISKNIGIEDVSLVNEDAPYFGSYTRSQGRFKMYINSKLARFMDSSMNDSIHEPTNTTVHELAHLFEFFEKHSSRLSGYFKFKMLIENDGFTHDKRFTEFMQYIAVISLLESQVVLAESDQALVSNVTNSNESRVGGY